MSVTLHRTASAGHADPWRYLFLLGLLTVVLIPGLASGNELAGSISAELWHFTSAPLHDGQEHNALSFALEPEYYHGFEGGSSISIVPFYRYDSADPERTHFDIRELNYHLVLEPVELRAGIGKVFWGATEFVHLVDVINQTDLVENPDGEDKLGQPMVQLIKPLDFGTFEFFVLPYFRERTFPGENGRFRSSIPVDTDNPRYEHDDEERHTDFASRISGTAGFLDYGLSYFKGTGREPALLPVVDPDGDVRLVPFYQQIKQVGLDIQGVAGAWLLKFEGFHRSGQGDAFYAYSSGVEYTFTGIGSSRSDLGVIGEYAYDDRGSDSSSAFQNDAMLGLRLALNDFPGTEVLAGYLYDIDYHSKVLRVEGSRRIGNKMKLYVEGGAFFDIGSKDVLYDLRNDDYLMLTLSYFF